MMDYDDTHTLLPSTLITYLLGTHNHKLALGVGWLDGLGGYGWDGAGPAFWGAMREGVEDTARGGVKERGRKGVCFLSEGMGRWEASGAGSVFIPLKRGDGACWVGGLGACFRVSCMAWHAPLLLRFCGGCCRCCFVIPLLSGYLVAKLWLTRTSLVLGEYRPVLWCAKSCFGWVISVWFGCDV